MKLKYLLILLFCSSLFAVAQPDYTEIHNTLNSQKAVTLQAGRTYNISNTIIIGQNQSLKIPIYTTIVYSGNSTAVRLNYGGSLLGDRTLLTNPISYLTTAEKTGVLVAFNYKIKCYENNTNYFTIHFDYFFFLQKTRRF
ncbi:MAG: hypothetical protein L3J74_16840 [Bacteroidales bacterium]|nr:hypothetical protein [Bacteroidales bacterium]